VSGPTSSNGAGGQRRRVVIIGGGFGGLAAARRLRHANVEVTLIDRMNHHLFQPLLYQVALGAVSEGEAASPIRVSLRHSSNTSVLMGEVVDVDADRREVVLDRGERLPYDSLIVACGMETSYFGNDEWKEVSCGLKTLADAVDLRDRIYGAFEQAERASNPESRAEWLTFVVVGGGPTGVEVAGALATVAKRSRKGDYARIGPEDSRIILLDAGDRVLAPFAESLSAKAASGLVELGVTVRQGVRASSIDSRGVTIEVDGASERIAARTVIWAAGVRAVSFTGVLARATGASTDRAGRIEVNPDLTLPGHPEISVIGDIAKLDGPGGKPLPGLATVAIQQAAHVAKAIRGGQPGASTPFRYLDKGALAVIGRGRAICEIRGLKLSGRPALAVYLGVHLFYLGGEGKRLKLLIDWLTTRIGDRGSQVVEGDLESVERAPPSVQAV
jgi:NADH:ubiquinone reductase (H+-translocating)